jgi:glutamate racemase
VTFVAASTDICQRQSLDIRDIALRVPTCDECCTERIQIRSIFLDAAPSSPHAGTVSGVRVAFVNSGLGLLPAAAEFRRLQPGADLVLSLDPDGMPWGPRPPADITQRTLLCARAALAYRPDALVLACNSASVYAIDALRAELEPDLPVVGTVPAVKPASAAGGRLAIWATVATTGSDYQRRLIQEFASGARVSMVACPGLADAVDAGDPQAVGRAVEAAAALTPHDVTALVLGCTEYELIPDLISAAVPAAALHGSAQAIAAQALRRIAGPGSLPGDGRLDVLLSGRPGQLPAAAMAYSAGREVAGITSHTRL